MHHIFQRFVETLNDSDEPEAFRSAMDVAAHALDLPCFAYLRMPRDGRSAAALISNYPTAWTEQYLKSHYEKLDPVVAMAHIDTEPFQWGLGADRFVLTDDQKGFFEEAASFGIRCGFTIPIQDKRGPVAAVTFANDARWQSFERSLEINQRVLQLMAICLHAHVRRKLWRNSRIGDVDLKPRELECLRWAAAGKTAWEIGQILGLSERHVVYQLATVRTKLGVHSLRQAIALYAASRANAKAER
jgi:DNA-binding CsgD family transcriptional regulator